MGATGTGSLFIQTRDYQEREAPLHSTLERYSLKRLDHPYTPHLVQGRPTKMTLKEAHSLINYAPGFDETQKKLLRSIVEAAFSYTDAEVSGNTPSINITAGEGAVVSDGDTVSITVNEANPGEFTLDIAAQGA